MILQITRQLTRLRFGFYTLFYKIERKERKLSKEALTFGYGVQAIKLDKMLC